jgi:hypothetical protein
MKPKSFLLTRRGFVQQLAGALAIARTIPGGAFGAEPGVRAPGNRHFKTRGVVLVGKDLSLTDWPERAKRAGLTTLALHHSDSPSEVVNAVQSPEGQEFLEKCRRLGLDVEYELHAYSRITPCPHTTSHPAAPIPPAVQR